MVEASNRCNNDNHSILGNPSKTGDPPRLVVGSPPYLVRNSCKTTRFPQVNKERQRQFKAFYRVREGLNLWRSSGWALWCGTLTQSNLALIERNLSADINDLERHLDTVYGSENIRFCYVVHHAKRDTRGALNVHFIIAINGDFHPIEADNYWRKKHYSFFSKLEPVFDTDGYAKYLASYLTGKGDFQKACFSYDWLMPHYWEFSQWHKKRVGFYPKRELITTLTLASKTERLSNPVYIDWWVSTQQSGYIKRSNERMFGVDPDELRWKIKHRVGNVKLLRQKLSMLPALVRR
jgi:hypothetical protein